MMMSPVPLRQTRPSTVERSAPHAFAASQSRTVYSYSRMAKASSEGDMASVCLGSDDTWRPTINTCKEGFAATMASTTLISLRMLGVEVSHTTASMFFDAIRSITALTEKPPAGASTRSTSCPFLMATPAAVAHHFGVYSVSLFVPAGLRGFRGKPGVKRGGRE